MRSNPLYAPPFHDWSDMGPGVSNATLKELLAPLAARPSSFFGAEHAARMPTVMWKMENAATERREKIVTIILYGKMLQIYQKHM